MTDEKRLAMLKWRDGIVDLVLDTDAATEVDDPFAIAYLLLSPERFRLQAIYAAPFAMNERTQDPAEGMEMSYEEILHIMRLCHKDQVCPVYRGAKKWLTEKTEEEIVQIRSGRVWSGSEAADGREVQVMKSIYHCILHSNSLSNEMDKSLLEVRGLPINIL